MKPRIAASIQFAALIAITTAIVFFDRPPRPLPISASPSVFSAGRAMSHDIALAQEPRPLGSAAHDRARDYITAQITALGLRPDIQRTTGITENYNVAGRIENLLTRIPGSSGAHEAVLLAAHYDSVPSGPGAGDDGAGVSVLLETLRALRAGPPLQNDLIFLFTDGEEQGLLGASAFVAEHPWERDVRLSMNFDCRGASGQVQTLLETSSGNGAIVSALAAAYPRARASSMAYEVYKRMPNDTDMTPFKNAGRGGLNFAFIGDWEAYHTPLDTPARLNPGSLQQMGEMALAMVRRFGDSNLRKLDAPDAIFFPLPVGVFVHYPGRWNWLILAILLFVGIAGARRVLRSGSASLLSALLGAGALLAVIAALTMVALGFIYGINLLHGTLLPAGPVYQSASYFLALVSLIFTLWVFAISRLQRRLSADSLTLSAALLLFLLSAAFTVWLPGASYLTLWPALALLFAPFLLRHRRADQFSLPNFLLIILISLPALLIFVILAGGFFEALGVTVPEGAGAVLVLLLLFLSLTPAIEDLCRTWRTPLLTISAAAALLLFLSGAIVTRYSAAHPRPTRMRYAFDSDRGQALWATASGHADTWSSQYLGSHPVRDQLPLFTFWYSSAPRFLQAPAPALSLRPPQITILREAHDAGVRTLYLRVMSPRGAPEILISAPLDRITFAQIDGKPFGSQRRPRDWVLDYWNLPAEGIELQLTLKTASPLQLTAIDFSTGLPSVPGSAFPPRPSDQMEHDLGDQTLVRRTFVF